MYHSVTTMANCYNNGIIYKLCCKDTMIKDIYVGSTCAFRRRKNEHKSSCTNENSKKYNHNVYKFIRDHGGFSNWEMIEIKKVNCETKRELDKEERAVLEMLGGTLNSCTPYRTKNEHKEQIKEWHQAHKEEKGEYDKAYRQTNKEQIKEKHREKFNCECGSILRKDGKAEHIKTNKHQKYLNSSFA
jgi:hypothetical protein